MKCIIATLAMACVPAMAQQAEPFTPPQLKSGADLYARNCSPCHGARMLDPQGAFDLRKFPHDQRERFVNAVTRRSEERRVGKECRSRWWRYHRQERTDDAVTDVEAQQP